MAISPRQMNWFSLATWYSYEQPAYIFYWCHLSITHSAKSYLHFARSANGFWKPAAQTRCRFWKLFECESCRDVCTVCELFWWLWALGLSQLWFERDHCWSGGNTPSWSNLGSNWYHLQTWTTSARNSSAIHPYRDYGSHTSDLGFSFHFHTNLQPRHHFHT